MSNILARAQERDAMKVWQKTAIITVILFILGALGAGWVYRPIVDYFITDPPENVNFETDVLQLTLNVRNRGKVDASLILVLTVENANISVPTIKPWMDYNETELRMHVTVQSNMETYRTYEAHVTPVNSPQNFTIKYLIVNESGFSIAGIISHLFLEAKGYYATHMTYNRTDTNTYELVK